MRPHVRIAIATFAAWLLAAPVLPQPRESTLAALIGEARRAREAGDHRGWLAAATQASALVPDHPDLLVMVSRAHAALGHRADALAFLRQAVDRGAGFDPARFPDYAALQPDVDFQTLAARARANLAPVARAEAFATLPADAEGIAFDPGSGRLFVGVEGALLQIDAAGRVTPFASGQGLRQILGIKIDTNRRRLWAVTGRFPDPVPDGQQPPEGYGVSGIYAFDLERGTRLAAHELDERPVLHGFNDMALTRDGTVYVTDSVQESIYVLDPGTRALRLLVRDASMAYPNGIVLSPDETRLYVAHVGGISIVDPRSGTLTVLAPPANATLTRIDGLAWLNDSLIGVQNSSYLQRVVRIRLGSDGRDVEGVETINARTPDGYGQTTVAVGDGALFVVGGFAVRSIYDGSAAEDRPQVWRIPIE